MTAKDASRAIKQYKIDVEKTSPVGVGSRNRDPCCHAAGVTIELCTGHKTPENTASSGFLFGIQPSNLRAIARNATGQRQAGTAFAIQLAGSP